MALWKETLTPTSAGSAPPPSPAMPGVATPGVATPPERMPVRTVGEAGLAVAPNRPVPRAASESGARATFEGGDSHISANLSIEGKIEGAGNVRIAGRFKGDVRIDGDFIIEAGAHLTGQVVAAVVVVGGELQGNIETARRVDVLEGGVVIGDVKAGSITVAAGSRMRGHVEFGWDGEKPSIRPGLVSSR